jgi:hypothetical protein
MQISQGGEGYAMNRDMLKVPWCGGREGSVMVVVMLVSGILMLASASLVALSSDSAFRMRRQLLGSQALNIAEAGIGDMIGRMSEDYVAWQDASVSASFGGGTFSVVSETIGGGNVLITSEGTIGSASRTVAVELLGTQRDRNDLLLGIEGAILSGGDVRFRTAAFTIRGNVHSNQKVTSANGAQNGSIYASLTNNAAGTISAVETIGNLQGNHAPNASLRELPGFNFDSYRQMAQVGGIYYEGNQTLSGWNGAPANGIVYVNGNVTIRNNSSLVGTLVANGDITLENNFTQTAFAPDMPALLATGTVTMGNRGRLHGLVYAGVNAIISNNVDVLGGIVSVGYTEINNHTDIYHPAEMPPWDPLQPAVPPEVIIGGWLR